MMASTAATPTAPHRPYVRLLAYTATILMEGQQVGHDQVLHRLGGGGMGVVYQALRLVLIASIGFAGACGSSRTESGSEAAIEPPSVTVPGRTLVWVDRHGNEEPIDAGIRRFTNPKVSRDRPLLLVEVEDSGHDLWTYDLRDETFSRLTSGARVETAPLWDGSSVIFGAGAAGHAQNLYRQPWDGSAAAEQLTTSPNSQVAGWVSGEGTLLLFEERSVEGHWDILGLYLTGEFEVETLLASRANERQPSLSTDGRWLAYVGDDSGYDEVYVRPFPKVDAARWQISERGGSEPLWGPDGYELFYREEKSVMVVEVVTDVPRLTVSPPEVLFGPVYYAGEGRSYDISPDGQRFVMIKE